MSIEVHSTMHIALQLLLVTPTDRMNREVLYLVGIFLVGCLAILFRSICFNLAGERFVARLRKKVKFTWSIYVHVT